MPNFIAAGQALNELREQAVFLYEEADRGAFPLTLEFRHDYEAEATLLGARTATGDNATPRDIGRLWTRICREELVAAYENYLIHLDAEWPIQENQTLTLT